MSTLSKEAIQKATAGDDLKIKPLHKYKKTADLKRNNHNNNGFGTKKNYLNKFKFGRLSYTFVRLVIVVVTSISLMELERVL